MEKDEKDVSYTIRFPKEMHAEIVKSAKENRRSINNEILTIFDMFIAQLKEEEMTNRINEVLTDEETAFLDKINSLPLEEQKAIVKKIAKLSTGN